MAFDALPDDFRQRYAPRDHRLFAEVTDSAGRRQLQQQVAEDLYWLIVRFGNVAAHGDRSTFAALLRVFTEQCELVEDQVVVKTKTGGACMQNPSDPEATYDGHKGSGSQVQLSETTSAEMPAEACAGCAFAKECRVRKVRGQFKVSFTDKQRRWDGRRREQATEAFGERYRKRSGIEGTNSGVKRKTGMARVRVRGSPAVFTSILLKVTGWNILRASVCSKRGEFFGVSSPILIHFRPSQASIRLPAPCTTQTHPLSPALAA